MVVLEIDNIVVLTGVGSQPTLIVGQHDLPYWEGPLSKEATRLWGGRFKTGPSPELMRLDITARPEWRQAIYDLAGSRAHARELQRAGVLSEDELEQTLKAIDELDAEVRSGAFAPNDQDEDVHTTLERGLLDKLGTLGGKLRAGRSRNDQAVTDLRLYLRDATRQIAAEVVKLQHALIGQARENLDTIAPGFTHLQPAQPISFAHQLADPVTGGPKRISLAHRHVPQTCSRRDLNRHSSNMGSAEQTEMRLQRLAHRTSYLHRMQTTTSQLRERLSKTFAAICHGRP